MQLTQNGRVIVVKFGKVKYSGRIVINFQMKTVKVVVVMLVWIITEMEKILEVLEGTIGDVRGRIPAELESEGVIGCGVATVGLVGIDVVCSGVETVGCAVFALLSLLLFKCLLDCNIVSCDIESNEKLPLSTGASHKSSSKSSLLSFKSTILIFLFLLFHQIILDTSSSFPQAYSPFTMAGRSFIPRPRPLPRPFIRSYDVKCRSEERNKIDLKKKKSYIIIRLVILSVLS
jgi:hypothetical protein